VRNNPERLVFLRFIVRSAPRQVTTFQKFIEIQYLLEHYKDTTCFTSGPPSVIMTVTPGKAPFY